MGFLNLDFGLKSGFLAFLIVAISLIILVSILEEHENLNFPEKISSTTAKTTIASITTIKSTTIPSFCQIEYNIINDPSRSSSYNNRMNDDHCDDSGNEYEKSPDWKGTGLLYLINI